jgi:hypothetical protein
LPKQDFNRRSHSAGYEPDELPGCSTPHNHYSEAFRFRQTSKEPQRTPAENAALQTASDSLCEPFVSYAGWSYQVL